MNSASASPVASLTTSPRDSSSTAEPVAQPPRRGDPSDPERWCDELGRRPDVHDVLLGARQRAQGRERRDVVAELAVVVVLEDEAARGAGPAQQPHPPGHRHPGPERVLVRRRDVCRGCTGRDLRRVQPVVVDRDARDVHSLRLEGRPGLGVARVLEGDGGADEPERRREGTKRGADPRDDEDLVGGDGHPTAPAEVLGEDAPQPVVRRPGTGVVVRHDRSRGTPRAAPGSGVDERGVRPPRAQVPPGPGGPGSREDLRPLGGCVHVGDGTGCSGDVGSRRDDRPGAGAAHDEPRGGELVVRRDDGSARQSQGGGEHAGRRQRVARPEPTGAQLGDDRVGDAVTQRGGPGWHVEGELDGASAARHPSTILVLRKRRSLDLGEGQLLRWTGSVGGASVGERMTW